MSSPVQQRNSELVGLLSPDFRRLYSPAHAMADVVPMAMMMPGLSVFWTGIIAVDDIYTNGLTGNNNATSPTLVLSNGASIGGSGDVLSPYLVFDGTNDSGSIGSNYGRFLGTETTIHSAIRGGTAMAWVYFDNAASADEAIIGRWVTTGNNRSYALHRTSAGLARFSVSSAGTAATVVTVSSAASIPADTWCFVAGRFSPSTSLTIWLNGVTAVNSTSVPASLYAGTANFQVACSGLANAEFMAGRVALPLVCKAALADVFVSTYFQMTAPLFGVRLPVT